MYSLVVREMSVPSALGSSARRDAWWCRSPDIARGSFIRSIQFHIHQERKRDHVGTVAIDVHRMLHHDSTTLTTRASGLGWTSAGLPHIQGVHRKYHLRINPIDPSSPLPKLTHTMIACFMLDEFNRCLFLSPSMRVIQFTWATRLNVLELLTLALAGESRTRILDEGIVHTSRSTRDRSITHTQLVKPSFDQNPFGRSHRSSVFFHFFETTTGIIQV